MVHYTQSGDAVSFMSVFEHVYLFSDRLHARCFVLGMKICSVDFYVRDGHELRLAAASG